MLFGFQGGFHYIGDGTEDSILNVIGSGIAVLFKPLGFGNWQAAVATVLGLVAKEEVVGVFGSLSSMGDADLAFTLVEEGGTGLEVIGQEFFGGSKLAAFSFMIFNLLCAPCFAAIGAIKREMNNTKWFWFAIGYMTVFAYVMSFVTYHIGRLCVGIFTGWSVVAIVLVIGLLYLLFRPYRVSNTLKMDGNK